MAKPELGTKHVCVSCGTRFYDLMRAPAVCPKCGTEQPAEQPRLRRAPGVPVDDKRARKAEPAPGLDDAETEVEADDEADEDVLEDASDLEDDADPLGEEIGVNSASDDSER